MSPLKLARWRARPGLQSGVLLVATLGLTGVLAQQAARSAASHRATAEETLTHYATIAAWQYTRQGRIWLGFGMNQAGAALAQQVGSGRRSLPGPELLARVLAEKECDCVSAGFARTLFRVTLGPAPELVVSGEPFAAESRAALLRLVAADSVPREGPRRWRMLPPGEPGLRRPDDMVLFWEVQGAAPTDALRAVYGMVVERAQIERPLEGALGDVEFFPPSLLRGARPDSVIRIQVAGPNHAPMFQTGVASAGFVGTDTLGWLYGNLTATAGIQLAAADRLFVGGLPASRVPRILALLALTLALGAGALLVLRREQRLARLRDDFVSGVSHELRTPLTQIRVLSELLQSGGFRTDAERGRATSVIHREALKLTNLVDNVLQFARLRREPALPDGGRASLGDVAAELEESFEPLLRTSGSRLEAKVDPGLEVTGDREAVARLLRNLIENAVKYGPAGQTIRLTGGRAGGSVRIAVEDEGPGVPRADRTRIWKPYHRLERDRNGPVGGSGLGLAVVAELTALMGGRAWVEDGARGGARFVVELPEAGGPPGTEPR